MLNMNYYTWSNMAAYKDHQKTLYSITVNNNIMRNNFVTYKILFYTSCFHGKHFTVKKMIEQKVTVI